jgi:menaquinone-dependent protoporphyrinogen oxidase
VLFSSAHENAQWRDAGANDPGAGSGPTIAYSASMKILVVFGSKRGGTKGIADIIGHALTERGHNVVVEEALAPRRLDGYDAVIVGGALYANLWNAHATRFVERHIDALRRIPVWFFSSGPLDESAKKEPIAPTREVAILMERVGAQGHMTFGGRLATDARGFPASAMAKKHAGDWRDAEQVAAWANEIEVALPVARPRPASDPPGRSVARLLGYAVAGWALCTATIAPLLILSSTRAALVVHAIAAPILFGLVAYRYFAARGARGPLTTATTFVLVAIALDLGIVAGAVERSLAMFGSFVGVWLPLGLSFLVTWTIGAMMRTMPWPKGESHGPARPHPVGA